MWGKYPERCRNYASHPNYSNIKQSSYILINCLNKKNFNRIWGNGRYLNPNKYMKAYKLTKSVHCLRKRTNLQRCAMIKLKKQIAIRIKTNFLFTIKMDAGRYILYGIFFPCLHLPHLSCQVDNAKQSLTVETCIVYTHASSKEFRWSNHNQNNSCWPKLIRSTNLTLLQLNKALVCPG